MVTATVGNPKKVTPKSPLLNLTLPIDNYNSLVVAKYEDDLEELAYQEELYDAYRHYIESDRYY